MPDLYMHARTKSNNSSRESDRTYERGEASAFAVHALSHLHALRQKMLNERRRIMENQEEKAEATAIGQQLLQEEEERAAQEQEQDYEQPMFLGNRLFNSQNG